MMYRITFRKRNRVGLISVRQASWSDVLRWLGEHEGDFESVCIAKEE